MNQLLGDKEWMSRANWAWQLDANLMVYARIAISLYVTGGFEMDKKKSNEQVQEWLAYVERTIREADDLSCTIKELLQTAPDGAYHKEYRESEPYCLKNQLIGLMVNLENFVVAVCGQNDPDEDGNFKLELR
jgi:hypothetical protein